MPPSTQKQPSTTTGEPQSSPFVSLDPEVFKQLDARLARFERTVIVSAVVQGLLASGKRPSPTLANLREVLDYATAVQALADTPFPALEAK